MFPAEFSEYTFIFKIFQILILSVFIYFILLLFLKKLIPLNSLFHKGKDRILLHLKHPLLSLIPALSFKFTFPLIEMPSIYIPTALMVLHIWIIASFMWLAISGIKIFKEFAISKYDISKEDNLKARKVHTQVKVIQQIINVIILIIGISCILMTFDKIRQLGVSLLASAGVVGIIIGFAAQKSIATLFAGLQIAITQPIRLDDVVIVENEWGWIEEITLTYVVVKIWDLRRLVVPITYFIDKPFQNWTRVSADILGTVFIYTDYTAPIEKIREKLKQILDETDLWDQKAWCLQVTDSKENTIELRALMSSRDSSEGWDLRCLVREKLISFMQKNYPQHLPRTRIEVNPVKI